jgi:cell division protein FtsN
VDFVLVFTGVFVLLVFGYKVFIHAKKKKKKKKEAESNI